MNVFILYSNFLESGFSADMKSVGVRKY